MKPNKPLKLVWDLPVRLCHWAMVVLVMAQWVTAELLDDSMVWHARFGYTLLGVVLFRLTWGVLGTHYAKFVQFIGGPRTAFDYMKRSFKGTAPVYTGHNPLGGWMSVLLLCLLLVQGVSGLFMTDDIFFTGPYYSAVNETVQSTMNTLHNTLFTVIQVAVALHIFAVTLYVVVKKQALVRAMFHGKKRTNARSIISNYWLRATILAVLVLAFIYLLVEVWPPEPADDWY